MNKPADAEITTKALEARKLKPKQEPLVIKAAQILGLGAEKQKAPVSDQPPIEMPYCNIACL